MKSFFRWFVLLLSMESCLGYAQFTPMSFMPENDLYKQDDLNNESRISEDEFQDTLEKVEAFYKPIVESHDAKLTFINKWESPTVNAYAVQFGNDWQVHMFGGLARRKEVTKDAFALVACHEVGHHLAGFPITGWAANEGQSDYFSTLSCGRELWKKELNENAQFAKTVPSYPKKVCDKAWHAKADRNLCYRLSQAGKSLADLLSSGTAKYETPSKVIVKVTMDSHPPGQCRLDTYLFAATCTKKFDKLIIPDSEQESSKYVCQRPRCWFAPSE